MISGYSRNCAVRDLSDGTAVSPISAHASSIVAAPSTNNAQNTASQPNHSSKTPPIAGLIIGTTAMPIVTYPIIEAA